jgi:putative Ca2+/H+ antiporter (TMEM165/GDT1 family)
MLAAVLLGRVVVAELPPSAIRSASAIVFFVMAIVVFVRKPGATASGDQRPLRNWTEAASIAFVSIFFSEWGDLEQITAATIAANQNSLFIVWLAATLALITKGCLAVTVGTRLRKLIPQTLVQYGGVCLFLVMALLSVLRLTR